MKNRDEYPNPRSQNTTSYVSLYSCGNGHRFQSSTGECPSCGLQGFTVGDQNPRSFNKAMPSPSLRK